MEIRYGDAVFAQTVDGRTYYGWVSSPPEPDDPNMMFTVTPYERID